MTNIEWTDVTDNIIRVKGGGWWCRKISDGCANCYAAKLNQSPFFGGNKLAYSGAAPELELQRGILASWARQTMPKKHFVSSMTDVFGEWVPQDWCCEFLDAMVAAPRQTFQVLTKRADVMRARVTRWLAARGLSTVPRHIWLGVSVENQSAADLRIPDLLAIPSFRFLSCEPLLGPLEIRDHLGELELMGYSASNATAQTAGGIEWVIIGGESGPGARPCDLEWIRSLVQQCDKSSVACFLKQLGAVPYDSAKTDEDAGIFTRHPKGGDPAEWPADLQKHRRFPPLTRRS